MGIDALDSAYHASRFQSGSNVNTTKSVAEEEEKKGKATAVQEGAAPQQAAGGAAGVAKPQSVQQANAQAAVSGLSEQQASEAVSQLTTTTSSDDDDDASYQAIVNKVNSGQQLTSAELSTLQAKDAALYARAVRAQNAREELRSQIAENPSKAQQQARAAISSVSSAMEQGEDLGAIHGALQDEYQQFAARFDQVDLSGRFGPSLMDTQE